MWDANFVPDRLSFNLSLCYASECDMLVFPFVGLWSNFRVCL